MCGGSEAKIRGEDISIYLGHYGGSLDIGDVRYENDSDTETKNAMIRRLNKFEKNELIEMLLQLVENGDE